MAKALYPLLAVSLALNGAFALIFGLGSDSAASSAPPASAVSSAPSAPPALNAGIWPSLKSDELPTLIARLRAAGFPPEIIRALIAAQVSESFAARRKALEPPTGSLPFWKDAVRDPKSAAALAQLRREEDKVLTDLLGEQPDTTYALYLARQGGNTDFLSKDKADAILRVMSDFNDRHAELWQASTGDADRAKHTALDQAQHDAIARLLTPAELFEFDVRNSSPARTLRDDLSAFNPTEAEFRAIYQLRQPFDEKYSGVGSFVALSTAEASQRDAAKKQLADQIKATLTPERAAEYERSTDYYYRQTAQLVTRLDLPAETTASLWTLKKDFEQRLTDTYKLPADQRTTQLATLNQEALTKVTPLLGNPNYVEVYKQYGGSWLNNLAPRPPAKPKG